MALRWFSVVVDCEDPDRLAEFWCQVLGYRVVARTDDIVDIAPDAETFPGIEFIRAERREVGKSPLHLDLTPDDQAAEVERLLALGARRMDVGQGPEASWVVRADPEGNAFCVLAPQPGWDLPARARPCAPSHRSTPREACVPTVHIEHAISNLDSWRGASARFDDARPSAGVVTQRVRQPRRFEGGR